jgi:hypothetical protein
MRLPRSVAEGLTFFDKLRMSGNKIAHGEQRKYPVVSKEEYPLMVSLSNHGGIKNNK